MTRCAITRVHFSRINMLLIYLTFLLIQAVFPQDPEFDNTSILYCRYGNTYYKTGDMWKSSCYNYTCTPGGASFIPLVQCEIPETSSKSPNCLAISVENTDQEACCNKKAFCNNLPPHLFDDTEYRPPLRYRCPDGWTDISLEEDGEFVSERLVPGTDEDSTIVYCLKLFDEEKTYNEAKKTCRDHSSFLINLDEGAVKDYLSKTNVNEIHKLSGTGVKYWTGLHYDGKIFGWDGLYPEVPQLNIEQNCGSFTSDSVSSWSCDYSDRWSEVTSNEICVAAKVEEVSFSKIDFPIRPANISLLEAVDCSTQNKFVCASEFPKDIVQSKSDTVRCDSGWVWNPLTKSCYMYLTTANGMPGFVSAQRDCVSKGGSLLNPNTTEKQYVTFELMRTAKPKPYSIWIENEQCTEYLNPYLAGTETLDGLSRTTNCLNLKPYICEKAELPPPGNADISAELTFTVEKQTALSCNLKPKSAFGTQPSTYIGPDGARESYSIPAVPSVFQASSYQCAIYSPESSTYIYSNVINFDSNGDYYYLRVRFPVDSIEFQGWHRMIEYFPAFKFREVPPNIFTIITQIRDQIVRVAFEKAIENITSPTGCNCSNSRLNTFTELRVTDIISISKGEGSGIVVTLKLGFSIEDIKPLRKKRQIISENGDFSKEWELLDGQMVTGLQQVLNLSNKDDINVSPSGSCPQLERRIDELDLNINLPKTPIDGRLEISRCGLTGKPIVTAVCTIGPAGLSVWELNIESCVDETFTEQTRALRKLSLQELNETNFIETLANTSILTEQTMNAADVAFTAEILENAQNFTLTSDRQIERYFDAFTTTVNNVMNTSLDVLKIAETNTQSSKRILKLLERLLEVSIQTPAQSNKDFYETFQSNLAYRLTKYPEITGVMSITTDISSSSVTYVNQSSLKPGTINNNKIVGMFLNPQELDTTYRKAFIVYANSKLHQAVGKSGNNNFSSVARIVSCTVATSDGTRVTLNDRSADLVTLHYPKIVNEVNDSSELKCGFWSPESSEWSTNGCLTTITDNDGVFCSCNHLTDFSVLLDATRNTDSNTDDADPHRKALTIITLVGLSISLTALGLVVLTGVMYKRLRKTISQKVLLFLAINLMGLNLTFLVGIDRTDTYGGCVTVAVFIHYFLLASFAWMTVEGILQYLRFVKVLGTYIPKFMLKASIPATLLPAVVVAVTLIVDVDLYKASDDYCWMRTDAIIYAVLIPIGLVLIGNTVIFILVIHGLTCGRTKMRATQSAEAERKLALLHFKAALSVFIVLGLTWVFGFLALLPGAQLAFQYLFCILNSIQGLLIFIFFNAREPTVRQEWRRFLCGKKYRTTSSNVNTYTNNSGGKRLANSDQYTNLTTGRASGGVNSAAESNK